MRVSTRDFGSDLRGQRSKIQPTIASGATAPMQKQMMVGRKRASCMGETASQKGPARGAGRQVCEGRNGAPPSVSGDTLNRLAWSCWGLPKTCDRVPSGARRLQRKRRPRRHPGVGERSSAAPYRKRRGGPPRPSPAGRRSVHVRQRLVA